MGKLIIFIEGEEKIWNINSRVVQIGRSNKNDLSLKDKNISRKHCNILKMGKNWVIVDCDSQNGTYVNGKKVKREEIKNGDIINLGGSVDIIFITTEDEKEIKEIIKKYKKKKVKKKKEEKIFEIIEKEEKILDNIEEIEKNFEKFLSSQKEDLIFIDKKEKEENVKLKKDNKEKISLPSIEEKKEEKEKERKERKERTDINREIYEKELKKEEILKIKKSLIKVKEKIKEIFNFSEEIIKFTLIGILSNSFNIIKGENFIRYFYLYSFNKLLNIPLKKIVISNKELYTLLNLFNTSCLQTFLLESNISLELIDIENIISNELEKNFSIFFGTSYNLKPEKIKELFSSGLFLGNLSLENKENINLKYLIKEIYIFQNQQEIYINWSKDFINKITLNEQILEYSIEQVDKIREKLKLNINSDIDTYTIRCVTLILKASKILALLEGMEEVNKKNIDEIVEFIIKSYNSY